MLSVSADHTHSGTVEVDGQPVVSKLNHVFLIAFQPAPLPRRSSQTTMAARPRCPLGFHGPESPPPRAGASRNSQRPGISMRQGISRKALKGKCKTEEL